MVSAALVPAMAPPVCAMPLPTARLVRMTAAPAWVSAAVPAARLLAMAESGWAMRLLTASFCSVLMTRTRLAVPPSVLQTRRDRQRNSRALRPHCSSAHDRHAPVLALPAARCADAAPAPRQTPPPRRCRPQPATRFVVGGDPIHAGRGPGRHCVNARVASPRAVTDPAPRHSSHPVPARPCGAPARPARHRARVEMRWRNACANRPRPAADRPARGFLVVAWWYSWAHPLTQMFHGITQA